MLLTTINYLKNIVKGDYYWRDWNTITPADAFVAGNLNNKSLYVAQAYVTDFGLYTGYIQDGQANISINTGLSNESPLNYSDVIKVSQI